ncbi:hypothetical protein BH23BAC1_BH23BAC1_33480 [soil metagenome]
MKLIRLNPEGDYDKEFGIEGQVETPEDLNNLYIQPNGKILLVGTITNSEFQPTHSHIEILRLNQDGSRDEGFGENGWISLDNSIPFVDIWERTFYLNNFNSLHFQPDGKIIVAGTSTIGLFNNGQHKKVASIFRLNSDGSLDHSFDQDGKLSVSVAPDNGQDDDIPYQILVNDLNIQSDGKILILGNTRSQEAEGYHMFLVRVFEDGSRDSGFNKGEIRLTGMGHYEYGKGIFIQDDEKMVILADYKAEEDFQGMFTRNQLIRLQSDGNLDPTFAEEGILSELPLGTLFFRSNEFVLYTTDRKFKISADGIIYEEGAPDIPINIEEFNISGFQDDHKLIVAGYILVETDDEIRYDGLIRRYLLKPSDGSAFVKNFTLINAITNDEIYILEDGKVINLYVIATKEINIRAFTDPETIGSVQFTLTGAQNYAHIENVDPYALFANSGNNFFSWKPALGNYHLTATPYSELNATGEAGIPLSISFSIIDVEVARVEKYSLINALSNEELFDLDHGMNIYLNEIGTSEINIRAYTNPIITGSVKFELFRLTDFYFLEYSNIENVEPYALFRNNGNVFFSWNAEYGEYHLIATAYSEPNAQGVAGVPFDLWFNILPHPMEGTGRSLSIYPNPGLDLINIPVNNNEDITVQILDLRGNVVAGKSSSKTRSGIIQIDVSDLDKSYYIIKIISGNKVKTFQWIKK